MDTGETWDAYRRLLTGLTSDSKEEFRYEGARLWPDDVTDMLLPSVLCLADSISRFTGLGTVGYDFVLTENADPFPLQATASQDVPFHRTSPFVAEAFYSYVLPNRLDVTKVFEQAAQLLDAQYRLDGREPTANRPSVLNQGGPTQERT